MDSPDRTVVLVSYGEIGTKSTSVRAKMTLLLRDNIAAVLEDRGVDAAVERRWSRLLVHTDDPERVARTVADVPGVVWARPAVVTEPTIEAVTTALRDVAASHGGGSFAVRARRAGEADAHPFTSHDVERAGGSAVVEETGAPVDLDDPDRTYRVEVREAQAFVSVETAEGPGGLPVGSQDPAVVLVSGGIDSPVAAYELLRRGAVVVPVYVDLGDYGGPDHQARAVEVVRTLRRYAPNWARDLRIVPAGDVIDDLVDAVHDTRMLSLRRLMLRIGEEVAREVDAEAVVTGEALGQKSSQTMANLRVTDAAVSFPVHRPLLTWDKTDIVAAARRVGTYDDSTIPVGCERIAPSYPETRASLGQVRAAEPEDLLDRAADAVAAARTVTV